MWDTIERHPNLVTAQKRYFPNLNTLTIQLYRVTFHFIHAVAVAVQYV
ncbi:MAG: hypothetical protein ACRD36_01970 [Candidatus Acidiferrum sp.]